MAGLSLKHIYKAYFFDGKEKRKALKEGNTPYFLAVKDFNLEIKDGEFIVFVGPSGCGKSTTLRMVAGLEEISQGELYIGDRLVNDVTPKDRDIAMVFQNYALYPHMTVYQNIAFALKLRKILDIKRDAEGNPIMGINKRKIAELGKEIKGLEKSLKDIPEDEIGAIESINAKIAALQDQIVYLTENETELDYYRHFTKQEIDERVHEAARMLDIESQLDKKPGAMSGGQRQRVALGRALVRDPKVFLLDEPLSNLDAKLRGQMRVEISSLHKKLKTTFIYVTHDQIEAMTMGDRIVVMKLGIVQQIDTPTNLFDYPSNVFVAGFIGTPQMNFYRASIEVIGKDLQVTFENGDTFKAPLSEYKQIKPEYLEGSHEVIVGLRGDHIKVAEEGSIKADITFVESLGLETNLYANFANPLESYLHANNNLVIKIPARTDVVAGQQVGITFEAKNVHFFDAETEETIIVKPEVVEENPEIKEKFEKELDKE